MCLQGVIIFKDKSIDIYHESHCCLLPYQLLSHSIFKKISMKTKAGLPPSQDTDFKTD